MASRVINSGDSSVNKKLQNYVPNSRTINGKQLDQDIVLEAADIGASEDFIITVTLTDGQNFTCDRTSAEINAAYAAGKNLVCRAEESFLTLNNVVLEDSLYTFYLVYPAFRTDIQSEFIVYMELDCSNSNVSIRYMEDSIFGLRATRLQDDIKAQFRANIGAGTSDFSGSYNDLTDKPVFSIVFENISVSTTDWTENTNTQASASEKADFPYMATISLDGVTEDDFAIVNFNYSDLRSEIFSSMAYTANGSVIICATSMPENAITLDSIFILKKV